MRPIVGYVLANRQKLIIMPDPNSERTSHAPGMRFVADESRCCAIETTYRQVAVKEMKS